MAVVLSVVVLLGAFTAPLLVTGRSFEPHLSSYQSARFTEEKDLPANSSCVSALGDPGMRSDKVRVAVEGWNFCNRAGNLGFSSKDSTDGTMSMVSGSPRWADCTDLVCPTDSIESCTAVRRVSDLDNSLRPGDQFPGGNFTAYNDANMYAVEKEIYLGSLCEVHDESFSDPWYFWMVMLKNGNFDQNSGLCPIAVEKSSSSSQVDKLLKLQPPSSQMSREQRLDAFPCFGAGCMNQPLVFFNYSQPQGSLGLAGGLYGTYDLDETDPLRSSSSTSFFSVNWYKDETGGSWNFHHVLRVTDKYPWLMLYLRADATSGESGGYPWETRGMMRKVPQSPNFNVSFTLNVLEGGGSNSQFYLLDIGGCWKNNGQQCDGDLSTDVTRYSEMIINPETGSWCAPSTLAACPPFHTAADGTKIHRTDTQNFPYTAYHYYCVPYNARYAEAPNQVCDAYSNPQPQELMQLLPHPEWAVNGYPASKGEGWIANGRSWNLDVGALSSRLFFYQDPNTPPAVRKWPSIDIGAEIFISNEPGTAEWVLSDFDVLVPAD